MTDVVIAGAGPAGWAAAHHCAIAGLDVALVAPAPGTEWPATYGMWLDECALLPPGSRWVSASATRAFALTPHRLTREYAVLDNSSVRAALAHPGVRVLADRVVGVDAGPRGCTVSLASGRLLAAFAVVDASGARRGRVEQTAFGVVAPGTPEETVFMDWRPPPGFDSSTFLYTVPLPGGRTLLEETSLAARPGVGFAELRARLSARGVAVGGAVERVRIPLDVPVPRRRPGVVPFGAAAGLIHPATGFSVAEAFRLAPGLAAALARRDLRAAWRVIWPREARAVHTLRRRGLAVLLRLTPGQLPEFFERFFDLSPELQYRYLSGRDDLPGTARAMAALFLAADRSLRSSIARFALFE